MAERTTTSSAALDPVAMAGRHQLPEPPEALIGRETELQTLLAHVGNAPIVIHSGHQPPGIGKTALALTLARRVEAYYSDAQFHIDLRGDSDRPLGFADALACLIQCLLPGAVPPDDPAELRLHYHSAFAGKRALILLTNAADAAQVLPLLPPEPCAVIITARNQLDLPGTFSLELGPLAEADAADLLLRLAPRIGPAVSQLAALCGGVPMALCAAGGLLGVRDDLTPQDYAREMGMRSALAHTEAADLALGLNHDLMLPEHVQRWDALSVFPADFNEAAASAVWELSPEQTQPALGELRSRSLVRHDPACQRYRLHERARLIAAERIAPELRLAAQCRHALHYSEVAAIANAQCERGPADLLAAMRFFRLEWANLDAAFEFARARVPDERVASQLCSGLARSCVNWLLFRISPAERLRWLEPALAAARAIADPAAVRIHLRSLATTYEALGDGRRSCQTSAELLSLSVDDNAGDATSVP